MNEPTNGELLVHLKYISKGVDDLRLVQMAQGARLSDVEGDVKVLQDHTPKQASGWGALSGVLGGFLGGLLQGVMGLGK